VSSVRELELPPGWESPSLVRTFGLAALIAAFGLAALAVGASGLTDTGNEVRLVASAYVLFGIGLAGGALTIVRRGLRCSAVWGVDIAKIDGTSVLRIRQPRVMQTIYALMILCIGGSALLIGAAPLATGGGPGVLMLACGAFLAGMPLVMIARGVPEIRLSEREVRVRGGGRSLTAAWDDMELVYGYETRHQRLLVIAARDVQRRAERFSWATRAQRRRDAEQIEIVTEHFAVDPVLLFHLLRFYHEHQAARAELATAAALHRLRDARFATP
jgi:hypothetical protein